MAASRRSAGSIVCAPSTPGNCRCPASARFALTAATTTARSSRGRSTTGRTGAASPSISASTSSTSPLARDSAPSSRPPPITPTCSISPGATTATASAPGACLDLFEASATRPRVLVNTSLYDYCPELVAAFRARGDEIVGHGRTNAERQGELDEAAERALIADGTDRLRGGGGTSTERLARSLDLGEPRDAGSPRRGRLQLPPRLVHGRPAGLSPRAQRRPHPRRALPAGDQRHPGDRGAQGRRFRIRRHDRRHLRRDARPGATTRRSSWAWRSTPISSATPTA